MTDVKATKTSTTTKKTAAKPKAAAKSSTPKKTATSAKKTVAKKAAPKKKSTAAGLTPEQRYKMVEVAAYYLAEKDGFSGSPVDYWIAAEIQISE